VAAYGRRTASSQSGQGLSDLLLVADEEPDAADGESEDSAGE
jgi:hypothetical protein